MVNGLWGSRVRRRTPNTGHRAPRGKAARQEEIVSLVSKNGEVSVAKLARRFRVSEMTVRRDLAELYRSGRLRRTHGGAVSSRAGVAEFLFQQKRNLHAAQKRAIGRRVSEMVKPGMTVCLDTGTTTLEVARALSGTDNLTVLTTSLVIAAELHTQDNIDLILLGGNVRKNSPDLTGPVAEENLSRFRADIAVIGADAVTADGVFTTDVRVARLTKAIADSAKMVVLATDSSKFGKTAFARYASFEDIDCVVTDIGCPRSARNWLRRKACKVVYVRM